MAKAIVTITDSDDGAVLLSVAFDPPVGPDEDGTAAQQLAAYLVEGIVTAADGEEFTKQVN